MRLLHDPVLVRRGLAGRRCDGGRYRATLAFARHAEVLWPIRDPGERVATVHKLVDRYPAFDLVEVVNGVPVLRMKRAMVEVVRYHGSHLAKSIRVRVLSRFAEPEEMAKLYWDFCARENLPRHKSSRGSLAWEFDRMHLVVDVGPHEEIHSARLPGLSDYPQVRRFAFPLDTVVRDGCYGLRVVAVARRAYSESSAPGGRGGRDCQSVIVRTLGEEATNHL